MFHAGAAARCFALLGLSLLAGCAQMRLPTTPTTRPAPPQESAPRLPADPAVEAQIEDPMAVHRGDRPLPRAQGALERIDCRSGEDDLQARIAFEARGDQVMNFAYYSRWKFQTCSIDLDQRSWDSRWRLTEDGATRVQTPHGSFLIRADGESFRFEFRNVERMKYCGMYGRISGELVVRRHTDPPKCEAHGILDL